MNAEVKDQPNHESCFSGSRSGIRQDYRFAVQIMTNNEWFLVFACIHIMEQCKSTKIMYLLARISVFLDTEDLVKFLRPGK
jgi:hypothetical protein